MPVKIFFYIFVIFLLLLSVNADAAQGVTLNYPPDKTVMEFGLLGISLKVPEGTVDSIAVKVNKSQALTLVPHKTFVCFTVPIEIGFNNVDITAIKNAQQTDSITFSVFRRSDLASKYLTPPAGYQADNFHMKKNEQCAECHKMEPAVGDLKPVIPDSFNMEYNAKEAVLAATSTCYSCHKKITTYKYVHGPAAVWSCLSCHDRKGEPVYSVKTPDTDLCFTCHTEQKKEWNAKKYTHGPVTLGKCAICHSPHATDNQFNLLKPSWDLCTTCHFEKGSGTHVLGDSMFAEGHPTRNRPDPIRKGKELNCASCHNPHVSNFPHLWAFEVQTLYELCQKCHNK